ncbi:hypothetical protein AAF712_006715 [Marasmius tenuissimus]|uniref:DUF6699 domain-containing protein n=1 Tax=Marasmius tenuissimus TaxID=585030 RepID=A0ABR2ZZ03_9AGAR
MLYDSPDDWVMVPGEPPVIPRTGSAYSYASSRLTTPRTTPVIPSARNSPATPPVQIYSPAPPHNPRRVHTPFPRGTLPSESPEARAYTPFSRSSPSSPPIVPPVVPSAAVAPPPPLLYTNSPPSPPDVGGFVFVSRTSPSDPPVIPPNASPAGFRPSSARPSSSSSRSRHSPTPAPTAPSMSTPAEIFVPPPPSPTPPPPDRNASRRRSGGPLVGEGQGWAYPVELAGTGLSYPVHSTPYSPYTPLPRTLLITLLTPPQLHSKQQQSTTHPYPPPLNYRATLFQPARPLVPLRSHSHLPQTDYVIPHSEIIALGGGSTLLDWDLLYPPTPEYAKLVNPATPYAKPKFSDPAFQTGFVVSKVFLRSSSHPVLAYWMDTWGSLDLGGIPTVGGLLASIHTYLHTPLTQEELDRLLETPQNKENVVHARNIRAREGCELVLNGNGFKRLDALGMHRKFAGVWVGAVETNDAEGTLEVEVMIGVRPVG